MDSGNYAHGNAGNHAFSQAQQPRVISPPTVSSSLAIIMAKNAEKNNEKLFPIFRKNLAEGGIGAYTATAEKLALWLSKDKAYYPQARPIIVDLLEAAYSAVRRKNEKGLMSYHVSKAPDLYVAPFMKMVRTMSPFYAFFSEEKLQGEHDFLRSR
ncbi:hypothetical protein BKA93DRAFT_469720 [Sparassis latifolia]